jgi:hypothetical protein
VGWLRGDRRPDEFKDRHDSGVACLVEDRMWWTVRVVAAEGIRLQSKALAVSVIWLQQVYGTTTDYQPYIQREANLICAIPSWPLTDISASKGLVVLHARIQHPK